jgi:hypothetical protein
MSCKTGQGDGFTFFQCDNIGEFNYLSDGIGDGKVQPYENGECEHRRTFTHKGDLKCQDCPVIYNEGSLQWEN